MGRFRTFPKLTKAQVATYVVQRYRFVSDSLNWTLYVTSRPTPCMARAFALVEKYCAAPEMQQHAIAQVRQAVIMRWRHMNGIYWNGWHGKFDNTPMV